MSLEQESASENRLIERLREVASQKGFDVELDDEATDQDVLDLLARGYEPPPSRSDEDAELIELGRRAKSVQTEQQPQAPAQPSTSAPAEDDDFRKFNRSWVGKYITVGGDGFYKPVSGYFSKMADDANKALIEQQQNAQRLVENSDEVWETVKTTKQLRDELAAVRKEQAELRAWYDEQKMAQIIAPHATEFIDGDKWTAKGVAFNQEFEKLSNLGLPEKEVYRLAELVASQVQEPAPNRGPLLKPKEQASPVGTGDDEQPEAEEANEDKKSSFVERAKKKSGINRVAERVQSVQRNGGGGRTPSFMEVLDEITRKSP